MTTPYIYKMINVKTGQYYVGCRYTEGCDPNEGFDIYASSSRIVKTMIRSAPQDWIKQVLFTGDTEAVLLEEGYLIKQHIDNPMCLNGLRSDGTKTSKKRQPAQLPDVDETALANTLKELGEKIRKARKNNNATVEELGKAIGVSRATMTRIEQGYSNLEISSVYKALQVLGL